MPKSHSSIAVQQMRMVEILRHESEQFYTDPSSDGKRRLFPSLRDSGSLSLSVVVPAKDEVERLPAMLEDALAYLKRRQQRDKDFTWEVIIVDDGSTDGTSELGLRYSAAESIERVRVLTLEHNRGKGGAVRLGAMVARGKTILMADADGATTFEDYEKLERGLSSHGKWGVAVGSRAHLEEDSIAQRSMFRTFLMKGFHFLVWLFAVRTVKDTQCGFKLFSRDAAKLLFGNLHVEKWAFDVELLYLAERLEIPIAEEAVRWREVDGSKITPVWSWLQMGRDLFLIWFWYFTGVWTVCPSPSFD